MMNINFDSAPNKWGDVWKRYVEFGIPPGSFGIALLTNDLTGAVMRADMTNKGMIPAHMMWIWENLPLECWGDEEKVKAWMEKGGCKREARIANG